MKGICAMAGRVVSAKQTAGFVDNGDQVALLAPALKSAIRFGHLVPSASPGRCWGDRMARQRDAKGFQLSRPAFHIAASTCIPT
jgi:hypothetical protein